MVEEGKGKQEERVPEPDPRSESREDSRRNRVKGKRVRSFMCCGNKGGTAITSSFEHCAQRTFSFKGREE